MTQVRSVNDSSGCAKTASRQLSRDASSALPDAVQWQGTSSRTRTGDLLGAIHPLRTLRKLRFAGTLMAYGRGVTYVEHRG
jgi:hypothetical protein